MTDGVIIVYKRFIMEYVVHSLLDAKVLRGTISFGHVTSYLCDGFWQVRPVFTVLECTNGSRCNQYYMEDEMLRATSMIPDDEPSACCLL